MEESTRGKPVIRGMYHLFLGNTAYLIITGISSILVARLLGPQSYALYGLALLVPSYLYSAIHINTSASAVRFSAKYLSEGDREKAVSFGYSTLLFQFLLALAAFLISLPFSELIATEVYKRPVLGGYIPAATASILGLALMNVSSGHFQGIGSMKKSAILSALQSLIRLVVSVGLIVLGFSAFGAVVGYSASYIGGGLLGLGFLVYARKNIIPRDFISTIRTSLKYSFPLYAPGALSLIATPFAETLLANFATNERFGGFLAAYNLSILLVFFGTPISTALFPRFSRLDKKSDDLSQTYSSAVKYTTLFILPVVIAMMVFATPLASSIYGTKYAFSGLYLAALAAPNLLVGFGAQNQLLNGIGETRKTMVAGLASTIAYLVGSITFVPFFSVYGIAFSSALSTIVGLLVSSRMLRPILKKGILVRSVSRIYVASAVAAVLVYPLTLLRLPAVATVVVGVSLYIAVCIPLLVVTRSLTKEDLSTLEAYFTSAGFLSPLLKLLLRYYRFFHGFYQ
ncbi:MAG: oligosaccharide flippase family protein [Nitrososphaerota archaeon]|nr:oligosaccharide flippase family protein [Nitrososphaerota archaeon]